MTRNRNHKLVLFILAFTSFSFVLGFALAEFLEFRRIDPSSENDKTEDFSPFGGGRLVTPLAEDSNDDGKLDKWNVDVRFNDRYPALVTVQDKNSDGSLDRIYVSIGPNSNTALILSDRDFNDEMDLQLVSLETRNSEFKLIVYVDLDYDGILDEMTKRKASEKEYYILFENTWTRAGSSTKAQKGFAQIRIDGEIVEVEFVDGKWSRSEIDTE